MFPRRTFLLGWLGGLLGSWLGQTQIQAAPVATPNPQTSRSPEPAKALCGTTVTLSHSASLPAGLSIDPATSLTSGLIVSDTKVQTIKLIYSSSPLR